MEVQFWTNEKDKSRIIHTKLIEFIEKNGFKKLKISGTNYILVKENNRIISASSEAEIIETIKNYLVNKQLYDVYEVFAKGLSSYISAKKLDLLKSEELINDRDSKNSSNFYFENVYCEVKYDSITLNEYDSLPFVIWEDRIIKHKYEFFNDKKQGQFELFCRNLAKNSDDRFLALKTLIGYLLHRNKDFGESKAVILYDENMGLNNQAHGGTGKTLLGNALSKCRQTVDFNGKEIKTGSWFKNQRIDITSDVLIYDDLNKSISLENFFPMITSGIEVEKKRQQAIFIEHSKSPKILISSNYVVKGPGGSSDERRRYEFEVANHYNQRFTPEMEFGNRFFDNFWGYEEWNKFYHFMMECVQTYLKHGLIEASKINLHLTKMFEKSCKEFIDFANQHFKTNEWIDKRKCQELFHESYPYIESVSPHIFKKWITDYSLDYGCEYESNSSGGEYMFILKKKKVRNG